MPLVCVGQCVIRERGQRVCLLRVLLARRQKGGGTGLTEAMRILCKLKNVRLSRNSVMRSPAPMKCGDNGRGTCRQQKSGQRAK